MSRGKHRSLPPQQPALPVTVTAASVMAPSATLACSGCRFWVANPGGADGGCRRFPPVPDGRFVRVPQTPAAHWCGEYQPREA